MTHTHKTWHKSYFIWIPTKVLQWLLHKQILSGKGELIYYTLFFFQFNCCKCSIPVNYSKLIQCKYGKPLFHKDHNKLKDLNIRFCLCLLHYTTGIFLLQDTGIPTTKNNETRHFQKYSKPILDYQNLAGLF